METSKIENALVPPERIVTIGGVMYKVKRLSMTQLLRIGAFAGTLQKEARDRILKATAAGKPDMLAIMGAIREEDLAMLLSVILRSESSEDLARFRDTDILEISDLAVAITEVNDFEKLIANFQKAAGNVKGLMSMMPSPPPSPK